MIYRGIAEINKLVEMERTQLPCRCYRIGDEFAPERFMPRRRAYRYLFMVLPAECRSARPVRLRTRPLAASPPGEKGRAAMR